MQNKNLKMLVFMALSIAIMGVLSQITIPLPFSPVPITGQTLAIGIIATILGARYGTLAIIGYLVVGAVGAPVFAGMAAGFSKLIGPTGGYLIGFIPTALFIGWYLEKFGFTFIKSSIANVIGAVITLTFGTIWLKVSMNMSWAAAFAAGAAPFILLGILKAILAAYVGIEVRKRLISAKLL